MTEPEPVVCSCGHDANRHGARAGRQPGSCVVCSCSRWAPPELRRASPADPHTDRDLFLAWGQASASVAIGDPGTGYEIMMREITRWHRRMSGLPLPPFDRAPESVKPPS